MPVTTGRGRDTSQRGPCARRRAAQRTQERVRLPHVSSLTYLRVVRFQGEQAVCRMSERLTLLRKMTKAAGTSRFISCFKYSHLDIQLSKHWDLWWVRVGESRYVMYAFPTSKKYGFFDSLHSQQKRNFSKVLVGKKINCVSAFWNTSDWPLQSGFYLIGSGNAFRPLSKWNLIIVPMPQLNKWQFSHKTVFFSTPPPS